MSVDITQDEMNILNLNGVSIDEVKSNIEYLRASGLDDNAIRQQYTETINELKPITKQSTNDTGKIKEWKTKGGITPFEYAQTRANEQQLQESGYLFNTGAKSGAVEFNGTYNNIDNNANLNAVERALKNSPRNEAVTKKIEENFRQKQERNKRVNEGTASFWDRAGAALDRMGNASYQAQVNAPADPVVKNIIESQNSQDKTGKINFTESLGNSFISGEWIPFIGGFIGGADDKKEREIQEKIRNSQPIRQDELNYLNYRLDKRQEENVRGYTWGGQVADGILPSMLRFGLEVATGQWVLKSLGLMPELAPAATRGQAIRYHLGNIAKGGAVNTLLPTGWNDTYQTFQERLLNNGMEFTDKGSYIFKESNEKPAISFMKSLGQTFVEFASEYSGGLLGMPLKGLSAATTKYIGTPISKYLASQPKLTKFVDKVLPELAKRYEILNKLKPQGKTYEFLKDMTRFDGFLEELGEEVVADVLNLSLGTGDEERSLENYAKAVFKSPDEWAVLAGAIALQGGTLSVASHVLGNYMERNGASDDEIIEVMNSLSESEKEKKISELTTEGLIDVSSYANEDMQQKNELKNRYYTQLKNAGREDDEALQTANIFSEIVANSAKEWGISLEDAENKFAINLQNMTDEEAYKQYQLDKSVLQGRTEYNESRLIDDKINRLFEEYDKLADDFSDEGEINRRLDEMQILQDIREGAITDEDKDRAAALIDSYEQSEPQLAAALRTALENSSNKPVINSDDIMTIRSQFQSIETAGAENNQTAAARKEWETKGTDSRFFKKWFGDSKVVDETGKPIVVYHGTENGGFEIFSEQKVEDGFFFTDDINTAKEYAETPDGLENFGDNEIYNVYLKIENPYIIDLQGEEYRGTAIQGYIDEARELGHDGVIIKNIIDKRFTDSQGSLGNDYIVFNPEQIKSVNNQGTFDAENPNIYYQRVNNQSEETAKEYNYINNITTGEKIDIEINKNIKTDRIKSLNLSAKMPFMVSDKPAENKKSLINSLNLKNGNTIAVTNKNTRQSGVISKNTIEKSLSNLHRHDIDYKDKIVIIYNIKKLCENAELILSHKDAKQDTLIQIKRFANIANINGKDYLVEIVGKDNGELSIYSINPISTKNDGNQKRLDKSQQLDTVNNSITYIQDIFKSKLIAKYNNDYKNSQSKNNLQVYFQSDISDVFKILTDLFSKRGSVTAEDVFARKRVLEPLRDYFQDVLKNTKVKPMPEWMMAYSNRQGNYLPMTNTIYLNMKRIKKYPNSEQNFIRTFLHELIHAKQHVMLNYAKKNVNNKKLSEDDRNLLKTFIKIFEQSEKDEKLLVDFRHKHPMSDIIKSKELAKQYKNLYDIYENSDLEIDADNVALALQYYIGNVDSPIVEDYWVSIASEGIREIRTGDAGLLGAIRAFDERRSRNKAAQYDRLSKVLNTNIHYQSTDDFADKTAIANARGFTYQRYNFDGTMKDNLITLLNKKADKSTLLHEFAHVYLTTLNNMARENDRAKEMLLNVNKWLRYDGNEYTVAQHEKFANGFVAYVKSGKAPTYGLKRAFENFKKWLNDLYTTLANAEDFFLDPETEQVFEELLGGSIHNAQKQEAEQLLYKAKRYAELRFDDEGLKTTINPNQLTERQRRYRDTAYDIIFYALQQSEEGRKLIKSKKQLQMILGNKNTAYGKKNKGIKHQAEQIYELLAELDDEFSANDGFLPEWGEFFNDPGISYENAESGADAELALDAYNVIVENRYLYDSDAADEFCILTEEEAQKNQYELEALLDAYKNADDKTIPMLAYYEWFDRLHPYIQEDFEKKWESGTNEIDRYQSLSKFEQAKEDLKLYAATLKGYGDYSSQFAEYSKAILKRLDFMTEHDKIRIFDKLKEYNSFRDIERNLDTVMDFAETLADVSMRKQLAADIDREVRQTIHEWQNGIKKTKYTYPANKLFTRLRELNHMKIDTLQDMYDQIVNEEANITYDADTVNDNDYYKVIEEMFVKYRVNGSYYNTTEFLKDLLDKIQNAKFTAKLARDEIDFERRMQNINLIDECARAVDTHKGKVSKLEQAYRHGFNLNSALEMMFNKEVKNKFTLDYLYAMKDAQVGADRNEVLEKIAKVFGYTGRFRDIQLFNRFINMTKKEFKIKQRYTPDKVNGTYRVTHTDPETGKTFTDRVVNVRKNSYEYKEWDEEPIELSRMELLYYYIQSKNSISYKMLTDMGDETTPPKGQFDKFEFDQLLNELTEQEKMMGDILQMAAEKYYPQLNQYHIKKYHTDLGKVNAYFPRKSETQDVKMLEMFNQYSQLNTNQRMQKQRTAGPGIRIAPANPVAVLFDHIEKANTLIIMGEQLDIMNSVFKDSDLQKKIKTVWGDDTAKEFMQLVTSNLYSGQQSTISEAESFIGKIENNVIKAQIFFKPQVGLKNVMSFMNYGVGDEYVSAGEWWKKFVQQTFTPKEWKNNIKYMMNIPYLKDRFGRGGSTDALKRQLEQRMFAKISLFDEIFSANVRYGDMGAIVLGGKPYIDCLLDKGYSEEQAIRIFIEKTVNDQQSSIPSTLSNIQRNAAHQPLAKMFFAYQNTPWQYFRTAANAIIRFKQNPSKETGLDMVKLVGCYMFLFPYLFNIASSLSPIIAATGGGDDELKEDFWKSVIGGVTFVPIAGMFLNTIYSGIRGERAITGNWFDTAASKLGNTARKINKGDVTPKDIFNSVSLFTEASTGIPATTLGTEAGGVVDFVTGSPAKGLLKMMGFTDYRAKRVTGEE